MNEKSTWERMEEMSRKQRIHDRKVILQAAMKGAHVELKTLGEKRKHPFAVENIRRD